MKQKILIIIILVILLIVIAGISLYFYSGGNISDWSENDLIETIEDNINTRSQITGNKLLVKKCIKKLNEMFYDKDVDAEFYIEDKTVYVYFAVDEKEMTFKKYIQNIETEEQLEKEIEEIDKSIEKYKTNNY